MKPIMSPYQIMFESLCQPVIACYELMAEYGKMEKQYLPHIHKTFNLENTTGDDIKIRGWSPVRTDCSRIDRMAIKKHNYVSDIVIKVRVGKLVNMLGSLATSINSVDEVKRQTKPGLYIIEGTEEFHIVAFAEQTLDEFLKTFNFKFNLPSQYTFDRTVNDAKINIDCEIVRGVVFVHWIRCQETTQDEAIEYIQQGGYLGMFPDESPLEYPSEGVLLVDETEEEPEENTETQSSQDDLKDIENVSVEDTDETSGTQKQNKRK